MHHGCEAGPTELRSICLPRETRTADQKVPSDGGDGLPGPRHEGEWDLLHFIEESLSRVSWEWNLRRIFCFQTDMLLSWISIIALSEEQQSRKLEEMCELSFSSKSRVCWMNSSMISKGFNWGSFVVLSTRVDSSLGNVCLARIVEDWPLHPCMRWQH